MIQFYSPDVRTTGILGPEDSAHCCRVLRLHENDRIRVVDGKGGIYDCYISVADSRRTQVEIIEEFREDFRWWNNITVAVAPTKNIDRMEWLVEKAVEIGVGAIIPVLCERSERKIVKTERLRKIAVSALKQSLKATLPVIPEMMLLKDFILEQKKLAFDRQLLFGYCSKEFERLAFVDCYKKGNAVTLMIGPEGDFSPGEVSLAVESGFVPVTFGDNRLRTETAAIYGLTAVHVINNLKT